MADSSSYAITKRKLEKYLETKLEDSPQLKELITVLDKHKFLPEIGFNYFDNNAQYDPATQQMLFNPSIGNRQNTAIHEYTHAADTLMENTWRQLSLKQRHGGTLNDNERRFFDAYTKLNPETSKLPYSTQGMKPEDAAYRFSPAEARAFGVGNMYGTPVNPTTPHYDPTMATEFNVLFDLFKRTGLEPSIK